MDVPLEIHEQMAFVDCLELLKTQGKILLYTALPNNTFTKSWKQRMKHNREGVRRGFPDLVVVTPDRVIFIEMKRVKGGTIQPEQKEWNKALKGKTTEAYICRGADEAMKILSP